MAIKMDGKSVAEEIENKLKTYISNMSIKPCLATILVGDDPSSVTYVNMKKKACERIGIEFKLYHYSKDLLENDLIQSINNLNNDNNIDGILIQHPLPKHIDESNCFNTILPQKDVDGLSTLSFGALTLKEKGFKPATPLAIMTLLKKYKIELEGKNAVVIGRSRILGTPCAMLLLNANATVTICHSKTKNLQNILASADIIVAAVGEPDFIKTSWLKNDVVIIDAGYNKNNVGDVDATNIDLISSYYTPVPGGVGPMTISMLLMQTYQAACNNKKGEFYEWDNQC